MNELKKSKFSPNDGKIIEEAEAKKHVDRFHKKKLAQGFEKKESYVHSQFFGRNVLEEMLSLGGKACVGLRFNFAVKESGDFDDGLVIYAVNEDGKLLGKPIITGKDSGDTKIVAAADGPPCPQNCIPPVKGGGGD